MFSTFECFLAFILFHVREFGLQWANCSWILSWYGQNSGSPSCIEEVTQDKFINIDTDTSRIEYIFHLTKFRFVIVIEISMRSWNFVELPILMRSLKLNFNFLKFQLLGCLTWSRWCSLSYKPNRLNLTGAFCFVGQLFVKNHLLIEISTTLLQNF